MTHPVIQIAEMFGFPLETPAEKVVREIAEKIHPTKRGRAFLYVQKDRTGLAAIDTIVVLASRASIREQMKKDINDAIMFYMGVSLEWKYVGDGYYRVTSEKAKDDSLAAIQAAKNESLL